MRTQLARNCGTKTAKAVLREKFIVMNAHNRKLDIK
jgi:hypothetical protein